MAACRYGDNMMLAKKVNALYDMEVSTQRVKHICSQCMVQWAIEVSMQRVKHICSQWWYSGQRPFVLKICTNSRHHSEPFNDPLWMTTCSHIWRYRWLQSWDVGTDHTAHEFFFWPTVLFFWDHPCKIQIIQAKSGKHLQHTSRDPKQHHASDLYWKQLHKLHYLLNSRW